MTATYQIIRPLKMTGPSHVFAGMSRTFCGRECSGWVEIDQRDKNAILKDTHCCARCAAGLRNRDGGFQ